TSSYLAWNMQDYSSVSLKWLLCFVFMTVFFGTQLILIKRALLLAYGIEHADFKDYIPTTKQFVNFLLGFVLYSFLIGIVYLLISIVSFPLLYLGVDMTTLSMEVCPFLTGVIMVFVLMRITFFPYFIADKQINLFHACRLSIALTRGNVVSLLVLFLAIGLTYLFQLSCEYFEYFLAAKIFSFINTFFVIPSVSLVMAVAYHEMLKDYNGGDDPKLLNNII
ncbi:MAG: hypothetical protein ACTJHT_16165, partial [Sphingobacterium sp.]